MGKRYQPGARGVCAESAFGNKYNIKKWLQCDLRLSNRDFAKLEEEGSSNIKRSFCLEFFWVGTPKIKCK